MLRRAVELGVTLIDTADAYGPEIAERLIGEALAPYAPGVVIATKGGITRQGPAKTEYVGRAGYLIQCVEMSLRRLKLERIDLYQLHRIDPRTPLEESLGALRTHAGAGKDSPHRLERSRRRPRSRTAEKIVPIVTVQNRYSLADRRHEETLELLRAARHRFSALVSATQAAKCSSRTTPQRRRSAAIAARHGATLPQLSLAWLLQRSPVMLPIPGTSKVAHLEENVAAAQLHLTAEDWAEVESAARSVS